MKISDIANVLVVSLFVGSVALFIFLPTQHKPELVCVRAEWKSPNRYVALNILISEKQYHNDVMTLLPLSQCREVK